MQINRTGTGTYILRDTSNRQNYEIYPAGQWLVSWVYGDRFLHAIDINPALVGRE